MPPRRPAAAARRGFHADHHHRGRLRSRRCRHRARVRSLHRGQTGRRVRQECSRSVSARSCCAAKHGETVYALSALPFGGYVKFAGESELIDEPEPGSVRRRAVRSTKCPTARSRARVTSPRRRRPVRAAVLIAGPFMNYLLAIVLYIGVFLFQGVVVIPTTRVGDVLADGPAQEAGIVPGDTIVTVSGKPVEHWSDVEDRLLEKPAEPKTIHLRNARRGARRDLRSPGRRAPRSRSGSIRGCPRRSAACRRASRRITPVSVRAR